MLPGAADTHLQYLNDSTLKNVHWALCTGVFGKRDVGRIEREFLDVLDFELGMAEDDLLSHHDGLSAVALTSHSHRTHFNQPHARRSTQHRVPVPVPDLEPSSPESSSQSSSSPRTPSTLASSPSYSPEKKSSERSHHQQPTRTKPSLHATTMELLRSFPIPLPVQSHHAHGHQRLHSQFPMRVSA